MIPSESWRSRRGRKGRKRDGHCYTVVSEVTGDTEAADETQITFPEVTFFLNCRNIHSVSTTLVERRDVYFHHIIPTTFFLLLNCLQKKTKEKKKKEKLNL